MSKGPASILRQRFSPTNAPVNGAEMNKILARLEKALTFNDTPTVKFDYSETTGLRAHAKRSPSAGSSPVAEEKCIPWKPRCVNEGTADAPQWKLYLDPGTVNGMLNPNWNAPLNIGDIDELYYIVLTATFTDGEVSSVSYSLDTTIPSSNDVDPTSRSTLATSIKILLGSIKQCKPCMVWEQNLSVTAYDNYHESRGNVGLGELPYIIWWKYIVKGV